MKYDEYIPFLLKQEGGFVDSKTDRGGATNHGISLKFLKNLFFKVKCLEYDSDKDGDIDSIDIQNIDEKVATDIYIKYFLKPSNTLMLPDYLQPIFFDMVVNSGAKNATILLQSYLNNEYKSNLKKDGVIGIDTISVISQLFSKFNKTQKYQFIIGFIDYRKKFYENIIKRDHTQQSNYKGWINRLNNYIKLYQNYREG